MQSRSVECISRYPAAARRGGMATTWGRVAGTVLLLAAMPVAVSLTASSHAAQAFTAPAVVYVGSFKNPGSVTPIDAGNSAGTPIAIGPVPAAMVSSPDGKTIWVVTRGDSKLGCIDTATNAVCPAFTVTATSSAPQALAITPDGKTLVVIHFGSPDLLAFDISGTDGRTLTKRTPVAQLPSGGDARFAAATPDGKTVWVTLFGLNEMAPYDVAANTVGAPVASLNQPAGIAISPDSKTAYVAEFGGNCVDTVTLTSGTLAPTCIPVGNSPFGLALTPNGKKLYVPNSGSNTVTPIETGTGMTEGDITVPATPYKAAVTADGATAYVTSFSGNAVTPIDVATGTTAASAAVASAYSIATVSSLTTSTTTTVTSSPNPSVFGQTVTFTATVSADRGTTTPTGTFSFVIDGSTAGTAPVDSTGHGTFTTSTLSVAGSPHGFRANYTPNTTVFFASQGLSDTGQIVIPTHNAVAYVGNDGGSTVTPIDTTTNVAGAAFAAGANPRAVRVTPDGKHGYVANFSANTVTPVDIASRTAGGALGVSAGPQALAITPDGKTLFLAHQGSADLRIFDIAADGTLTQWPGTPYQLPSGSDSRYMTTSPDGQILFVSHFGLNEMSVLFLDFTNKNVDTGRSYIINNLNQPAGIAVVPTALGSRLYIAEFGAKTVDVFAGAHDGSFRPANPPTVAVGNNPTGIAATPDAKTVYVANSTDQSVTPIDTATLNAGAPIVGLGSSVDNVAMTPDGTTVYITSRSGGKVIPISTASNTAGTAVTVTQAFAISIAPGTSLATTASAGVAVGGKVHDSATLSNGFNPTGTITFKLYGPNDASCGNAAVFTSTVNVNAGNGGYGSGDFTTAAAGTYRWTAAYGGDSNNAPSSTACNDANESVVVSSANDLTATGTSFNAREGKSRTGKVAALTDPGSTEAATSFSATISWGDSTSSAGVVSGSAGSYAVTATHTYADEGQFTVSVVTNEIDGDTPAPTATATGTATVAEADRLTAASARSFTARHGVAFSRVLATFTDAVSNVPADFNVRITWGDGSPASAGTVNGSGTHFSVSGTHTYARAGTFNVTVTFTDGSPGTARATAGLSATVS